MEYKIISTETEWQLIDKVKEDISQGWIPCGGVNVSCSGSGIARRWSHTQAMTRSLKPKA
jgi:hypothetical protein